MTKFFRAGIVAAGLGTLMAVTYWWATFATSFKINMCYSEVISFVSDEAATTASSQSQERVSSFKSMLGSLPLRGYETNCDDVLAAIAKYKGENARK